MGVLRDLAARLRSREGARLAALPAFTHLRTKLTVLYAGLFVAILIVILSAVYAAVARNAERIVRDELAVSGLVFDRIWGLRTHELQSAAGVLARDFGFRAAVATNDAQTIQSALDNLRARAGIDAAFVVGLDGQVLAASGGAARPAAEVLDAIAGQDEAAGVFVMGGAPYEAVSAPILTPALTGWVVFAVKLDKGEMTALEQLSAIPLQAAVLVRGPDGRWKANTNPASDQERAAVARFLDMPRAKGDGQLVTRIGPAAAVIKPLAAMADDRVVLLLRYPIGRALEPYNWLLGALLVLGLASLGVIAAGSFALARNVTRPLLALRKAAERLERGEEAQVEAAGADEIAELERTFNRMAQGIRERERALDLAREKAEAANRAKSQFLSNMSHEVRTPLNGILGMTQVMARASSDEAQKEGLEVIRQSGESLLGVLNGILDITKIEAGELELEVDDFDLEALVRGVCDPHAAAAEAAGLAFEVTVETSGIWRGDRRRVGQVLDALVSNAVKFTQAGRVTVSVHEAEGAVRFVVSDTGPGIGAEWLNRVFAPFAQVDSSATRRTGGVGLGLSFSRDLAELMGGALTATSREGEGSQFVFAAPLERRTAQPPREPGAPLRILAAEDNKTNQLILTALLEQVGAELTLAETGREAVEAFAAGRFDLILMDIQMPEMGGVEATLAIRKAEADQGCAPTPIVAVTANVMSHQVAEYLAAGMQGVVAKPIEAVKLFAAMEAALDAAEAAASHAA